MSYPTTRDTFAVQYNRGDPLATSATAEFINDVTGLLVAIEDKLGLDSDVAATGGGPTATVEARIKRLEASPLSQAVTFSPTQPTTGVPHDVWVDTTASPWKFQYFTAAGTTGWELVGANAVQILGRDIDSTAPTIDNQALVWDNTAGKIKFGAPPANNPFTAAGDMIIGDTPDGAGHVGFAVLHHGSEKQALVIQTGSPTWVTPPWVPNSVFTARGQLLVSTGASNYSPLANAGSTDAGKVLGLDGTGYPSWLPNYRPIPITNDNDVFYGMADGTVHRLGGADDNANGNKVLTIIPGSFGFGPSLNWQSPTPLTTVGDILYINDGPTSARLPIGANGYVLTVVSGKPAWAAGGAGGTGIAGVTIQDEGTPQGSAGTITTLNFVGTGVTASVSGGTATITIPSVGGGGSGSVTSVGISLPSIFNVIGSPVTNSGTITATLANQSAGTFLAGPASGGGTTPGFRTIQPNDIPLFGPSGPSGHNAGGVPDPGNVAGNTRFLREDGIWAAPAGTGGSGGLADPMSAAGDLIYRNTSNLTTRLSLTGRSNGDVLTVVDTTTGLIGWRPPTGGGGGAGTIIVEDEGGTGVAASILNVTGPGIAVSVATGIATLTVPNFGSAAAGTVPASGGGTVNFLRADGTWAAPTGGGGAIADHVHQGGTGDGGPLDGSEVPTWLDFAEHVAPTAPLTSHGRIYAKPVSSVSHPFWMGHDGTEHDLLASGGGGGGSDNGYTAPPLASTWTTANFTGCTLTDVTNAVVLSAPVSAGHAVRRAKRPGGMPTGNYTIMAVFRNTFATDNNAIVGIGFESADGKLSFIGFDASSHSIPNVYSGKFTDQGTYNGNYTVRTPPRPWEIALRITYNATTDHRTYAWSYDHRLPADRWDVLTDVSVTDFHTPTDVFWFVNANGGATDAVLLSWEEA